MKKITYDFKNRTAIVTGGAQGFGLDIAKRFLNSGGKGNHLGYRHKNDRKSN